MDLLTDLNPPQREAVLHERGPLLILAGAGSGKTRVITHRIARLIGELGLEPWRILAVTFTNKAAGEMRERVERLVGSAPGLIVSTFHSFGARLLRQHAERLERTRDFTIYDQDDTRRLGRELLRALELDPERFKVERLLAAVEREKQKMRGPSDSRLHGPERVFYERYQLQLKRCEAFDFSDLIFQTVRLLERCPDLLTHYRERFRQVMVDEFQDTDRAQYRLLRLLCPPDANLSVVGDDDQSIYAWRGADLSHILGFERDYPGARVVRLEQNYRSSAAILDSAAAVIARNTQRHDKRLWTAAPAGEAVQLWELRDEREEAEYVAAAVARGRTAGESLRETAVFYRTNAQSRALEEALRLWGLPYVVVGGTRFFDRMEVRDLLAYLRLVRNPASDVDALRVLNTPPRGIGERSRERLQRAAAEADFSLVAAMVPERLAGMRAGERQRVLAFADLLAELRAALEGRSAAEAVAQVLKASGYERWLRGQGTDEAYGRLENLQELVSAALDFAERSGDASLDGFLEHVALVSDIDLADGRAEAISLMTLHSAKGLEFDQVFLTGLEENLLPHRRVLYPDPEDAGEGESGGVEEERRLCYVGMTRARRRLCLSWCRARTVFGRTELNPPSRFLFDLPGHQADRLPSQPGTVIDLTDVDLDEADDIYESAGANPPTTVDYGDEFDQSSGGSTRPTEPRGWLGRAVLHSTFGRGRVRDAAPARDGIKLTVEFDSVGRKTVLANFVRLV